MTLPMGPFGRFGRRNLLTGLVVGACAFACAPPTTPWPSSQARMRPRPTSLHRAPELPDNVRIVEPGPDVPEELRGFSGSWTGSTGTRGEIAVEIAVERVTVSSLSIVYAGYSGLHNRPPFLTRMTMERVGSREFSGGAVGFRVALRLRDDGNLDILAGTADLRRWQSGVLTRQPAAAS